MAKAKKLPSGSWRTLVYDYTDSNGKRHYKSFTADTKKESEYMAATYAIEDKRSENSNTLTFGQAFERYIEKRESILSPSTIREYKRMLKADLTYITQIKINDITQELIQTYVNDLSANHSPKTVRNIHGAISAIMKTYRPGFRLTTELPKKIRPNIYVPADKDIKILMDYVEGDVMEIPILLAAFGPMRRGEICALDSDHIKGNIVHVESAMVLNDNHEWVIKAPKSFAGNRYIPFPDFVIDKMKGINGRIVELYPSQVSDRFIDILKRSGLPHFRFHDLRHYCASIQHALGIADAYIMQRGGWGNDSVLKNVYRHAMEQEEMSANNKANEHFKNMYATRNATQKNKSPD